jgi:hypothetical protein
MTGYRQIYQCAYFRLFVIRTDRKTYGVLDEYVHRVQAHL